MRFSSAFLAQNVLFTYFLSFYKGTPFQKIIKFLGNTLYFFSIKYQDKKKRELTRMSQFSFSLYNQIVVVIVIFS